MGATVYAVEPNEDMRRYSEYEFENPLTYDEEHFCTANMKIMWEQWDKVRLRDSRSEAGAED